MSGSGRNHPFLAGLLIGIGAFSAIQAILAGLLAAVADFQAIWVGTYAAVTALCALTLNALPYL